MDVVIFGIGFTARSAAYFLSHDSKYRPVAFTLHERFIREPEFTGLPVRRFEDLERTCPPERVAMIAPPGWMRMGALREEVVAAGKAKGYRFASYVSSRAMTWPGLAACENCPACDGVIVEPYARIGENCIVRAGATLSHDVELGDHCFVAPRASIGGCAIIGHHCVIGANSTITDSARIAPAASSPPAPSSPPTPSLTLSTAPNPRRSPVTVDEFRKFSG